MDKTPSASNHAPTPRPLPQSVREGEKNLTPRSLESLVASPSEGEGKETAATLKILGLITARGGSKSVPRKNILPVAGRPLLAYTCEAAKGSRYLSRVILSTDDDEISEVGQANGVEVPFKRPAELAQDDTPSIAVAQHALKWLADNEGWQADILVLLQPTSPLRQAQHIDEALAAMLEAGADTVVSVVAVPHPFSPYKVMELRDGLLHNFWTQPLPFDPSRRQNVPTLYARNGPAVLASRAGVIERGGFYGDRIVPYVMTEADSVDVDTPFDLRVVEWLLREREVVS
jgi:CMP-N,N'-diacetyllegionaminic acid synthase